MKEITSHAFSIKRNPENGLLSATYLPTDNIDHFMSGRYTYSPSERIIIVNHRGEAYLLTDIQDEVIEACKNKMFYVGDLASNTIHPVAIEESD